MTDNEKKKIALYAGIDKRRNKMNVSTPITRTDTRATDPEYVARRLEDDHRRNLPWYLKDKNGYPIEFQEGKGRLVRIICQNIRKVTG